MKSKQRGDTSLFILALMIIAIFVTIGIVGSSRLTLQEAQELQQKCLELGGEPLLKKYNSDNGVQSVACRKGDAVYEKF